MNNFSGFQTLIQALLIQNRMSRDLNTTIYDLLTQLQETFNSSQGVVSTPVVSNPQMSEESAENSERTVERSNEQAKQASLPSVPMSNSIFPIRDDASDPELIILLEAEGDPHLVKQEKVQPDSQIPPAADITISPTSQNEIALEANQNIRFDLNDPIGNQILMGRVGAGLSMIH